jgi:transposase
MVVEMSMNVKSLLGLPEEWEVVDGDVTEKMITVVAVSTQTAPCCPLCGTTSSRIHSHYSRQLADVPCAQRRVRLILRVRKFFCDVKTCPRKIFTERLAPFIQPWARMTARLFKEVEHIGLATSGMLGTRLGERIGIRTSWMTILRRIMARPAAPVERVVQLGIDDFSFRRGRTFGTILVDMQSHKVIDLLLDRKVETASAWMSAHPEIDLVSRDRAGDYASAAKASAPQAVQCADRFHILKNLGEALEGVLARHLAAYRRGQTEKFSATPLSDAQSKQPPKLSPKATKQSQAKREERLSQYKQVVTLRKLGLSQTAIADQVGIGHATVSRWLTHGTFPEQQPRQRMTSLDSYLPFLRERWEAGCHNIAQLYRELVARDYTKSYESVYDQLVRWLPEGKKNAVKGGDLSPAPLSSRRATFLFLRRSEELETDEQETLIMLRQLQPEVDLACDLVQQFAQMLRTRTGEQLDSWLEKVRTSQIPELQSFVLSVERDKPAIVAGLTLPQNNGLVEGHVNKLKLIKRMGYGRAGFPLLRQRVIRAL